MMYLKKILRFSLCCVAFTAQAETIDGWNIKAQAPQIHEKFFETVEMETYTGDTVLKEILYEPTKESLYVTVHLNINRNSNEGEFFDSSLLTLKTPQKTYTRLPREKDFLHNYNISSFPYLKVKKGTHNGTLLFEIPKAENQDLTVYYKETKLDTVQ